MGKFNPSADDIYQEVLGALNGRFFLCRPISTTPSTMVRWRYDQGLPYLECETRRDAEFKTGNAFPYPGATPSISANGTSNAILWAVENNSKAAVLHAYDATTLANELYNSGQASGSRDHLGRETNSSRRWS